MIYCEIFQRGISDVAKNIENAQKVNDKNDLATEIRRTVSHDIEWRLQGKQWLLSCYAPFVEQSNLPGFVDDLSFEEVHFKFLQSKKNGTLSQYTQEIQARLKEARQKYEMLRHPSNEMLRYLVDFHSGNIRFNSKNPFYERCKNTFGNFGYDQGATSRLNIFKKPQTGMLTDNNPFEINSGGGFGSSTIENKNVSVPSKNPFTRSFVIPCDNGGLSSQTDNSYLFTPAITSNSNAQLSSAKEWYSQQSNAFTNLQNFGTNAFWTNQNPYKWVKPENGNIFQSKQTFADNPFYRNSHVLVEESIDMSAYSKLEELTLEELQIYESDDDFVAGRIPVNPPTYEMCHRQNLY